MNLIRHAICIAALSTLMVACSGGPSALTPTPLSASARSGYTVVDVRAMSHVIPPGMPKHPIRVANGSSACTAAICGYGISAGKVEPGPNNTLTATVTITGLPPNTQFNFWGTTGANGTGYATATSNANGVAIVVVTNGTPGVDFTVGYTVPNGGPNGYMTDPGGTTGTAEIHIYEDPGNCYHLLCPN